MKWIIVLLPLITISSRFAFIATLHLQATWTAITKADMREFMLCRMYGIKALIATILHPDTSHNFSVIVPPQSSGTMGIVLTAVSKNNQKRTDRSSDTYSYNLNTIPPAAPRNLSVQLL